MLVQKFHQGSGLRQQNGGTTNAKSTANASNDSQHSAQFNAQTSLLRNYADQSSSSTPFSSSFENPMDDADTLMRAIIANQAGKSESTAALDKVTQQFQSQFAQNAANKTEFHALMQKSFGENYSQSKAEGIRQQTLSGDFSWMPNIQLVDGSTLSDVSGKQGGGVGSGAYSKSNDTIYISKDLVTSNPSAATRVLTEEVGHAIDARVNTVDAAGDEGSIFARLSSGETISESELATLRSENDSGTITVDGKEIEVEFFFPALAGLAAKGGISNLVSSGLGNLVSSGIRKLFGTGIGKAVSGLFDKVFGGNIGTKLLAGLKNALARGIRRIGDKAEKFVKEKIVDNVRRAGRKIEEGIKSAGRKIEQGVRSIGRRIGKVFGW